MAQQEKTLKETVQKLRLSQPARLFYERSVAFLDRQLGGASPLTEILPDTEEWKLWETYFRWWGWEPKAMEMVRRKQIKSVTMPAKFPEWFDTDYAKQAA